MEEGDITKLTTEVLAERDRSAMLMRLTGASLLLPLPELLSFLTDVLLIVHRDRDRLKARVAHLVAAAFRRSSEQSSAAQIALFATVVEALKQGPTASDAPASGGAAATEPSPAEAPKAEPTLSIPELLEQTEREIKEQVDRQLAARKAEQARRREAALAARDAQQAQEAGLWPKHLPIREVTLDVDPTERFCADPDCRCERAVIGRETTWQVEREVKVDVLVTHRLRRACAAHHGGPVIAPVPPKPVDKGHLGFELAAHAIYLRFSHNLPIRRIVDMLADELCPVSEEMLHTLFDTTSDRMESVLQALINCVRAAKLVNLDDTPVLIIDPEKKNRRRTGRIWVAVGDNRYVWFFSAPNWKSEVAENRLGQLVGTLQGDGYPAFKRMAKGLGVKLAGCMAHLRRKLRRAMLARDPRATEALALVQGLYRVEKLARLQGLDEQGILALRRARAVPLMAGLERWARTVAPTIETGSPMGEAWTYLNNQWDYLQTYLSDGRVSIDNNAAERALRRITIGRKLWLFFRGDVTVERAARLASLLATARLHGANELEYLRWLLQELARREWSVVAAARLLPDAWMAAKNKKAEQGSAVGG